MFLESCFFFFSLIFKKCLFLYTLDLKKSDSNTENSFEYPSVTFPSDIMLPHCFILLPPSLAVCVCVCVYT